MSYKYENAFHDSVYTLEAMCIISIGYDFTEDENYWVKLNERET